MYPLQPYTSDFVVVPKAILYRLPNYHQANDQKPLGITAFQATKQETTITVCANSLDHTADPLTRKLKALEKRLDTFISSRSVGSKPLRQPPRQKAKQPTSSAKGLPIPVDAQVCSQPQSDGPNSSNAPLPLVDTRTTPRNAAIRRELAGAADLKLTLRDDQFDKCWLELLSAVGARRGVEFFNVRSSDIGSGKVLVKVTIGSEELRLECPSKIGGLRGELEVWKCLGALLGLYTTSEEKCEFERDEKWLLVAKKHHEQIGSLDAMTRLLGVHLAANDFLSGGRAVGLPDLILRSFYRDPSAASLAPWQQLKVPNNVQLWAKRVDDALS